MGAKKDPIRIPLAATELARMRFAVSPVYETFMAVDALRAPGAHAVHLPWVRASKKILADREIPGLAHLLEFTALHWKPAFLLPVPDDRMPPIAAEIKRIKAMAPDRVTGFIDKNVPHPTASMRTLRDDPKRGLARLAATIEDVYAALIEPHWPRLLGVLEADIAFRAGTLSDGGVEAVFANLHKDVDWTGDEILIGKPHLLARDERAVILGGRALVLCPSAFAWPDVWVATRPDNAGVLRYPARGIATIWEARRPAPSALEALLGKTRAEILVQLSEPQTTAALSAKLGVTSGAVSQHLGVLRGSGLVATRREGRAVLHLRTDRAESLVR